MSSGTQRRGAAGDQPLTSSAVTQRYHELTRHSYESVRRGPHGLDWANQPSTSKRYLDLVRQPLPHMTPADLAPTLDVLRTLLPGKGPERHRPADLSQLSALCQLGYGITARKTVPGLVFALRAAPSAGALYPCELYVCTRSVEGIADGAYHYGPGEHSLSRLREGDLLPYLGAATGDAPALASADVVFVISAIWWRSAWKYRSRAYRYCLDDTGHLAGNLLLAGQALGYRPALITDFVDDQVNHLLGLDAEREAALAMVACRLGIPSEPSASAPTPSRPALPPIAPDEAPLSARELSYPQILEAHEASSLPDVAAFAAAGSHRTGAAHTQAIVNGLPTFALPDPAGAMSEQPLAETIAQRRSTRGFARRPISLEALGALLAVAVAPHASDQAAPEPLDVAVVVHDVDGLPPGVYHYVASEHRLVQVRSGDLRGRTAYVSLEQRLCGDAAVSIFFLADLARRVKLGGERAYRRLHIEAGLRGQFIYLASRSLGLGCSGIGAFYDDEAAELLQAPAGTRVIYELVVGPEEHAR